MFIRAENKAKNAPMDKVSLNKILKHTLLTTTIEYTTRDNYTYLIDTVTMNTEAPAYVGKYYHEFWDTLQSIVFNFVWTMLSPIVEIALNAESEILKHTNLLFIEKHYDGTEVVS